MPRAKVVAGSSAINGQILPRGLPEDFDQWAAAGNDAWSFTRVLPLFRRLETDFGDDPMHGASGPIPVRRIAKPHMPLAFGVPGSRGGAGFPETRDHNHPDTATGVGPRPINNVGGLRMSTAVTDLHQARGRPNLTIRGDLLVRRVLVEAVGGRRGGRVPTAAPSPTSVSRTASPWSCTRLSPRRPRGPRRGAGTGVSTAPAQRPVRWTNEVSKSYRSVTARSRATV